MEMPLPEKLIDPVYVETAISYANYIQMVEELLAAGKATGHPHPEIYLHYTKMNLQRMHRLEKTLLLIPAVKSTILAIDRPQTWLVLTEGWCGDAAQSMPVMQAFSKLNPLIELKVLLRDENPALMDQHLTNGVSRSIPKLIAVDRATRQELFTWGPRPQVLQETFYRLRAEGLHYDDIKEQLQRWYNADKTTAIQEELAALVTAASG
jgi:hypothetical protein